MSRDPVPGSLTDGLSKNPYLYAMNNVVNYIDNDGMAFEDDIAPAFNEVRVNPYASVPDSTPVSQHSMRMPQASAQSSSRGAGSASAGPRTARVAGGAAIAAVDAAASSYAKTLPSQVAATVAYGKYGMPIGSTWVNHTGNIMFKRIAGTGVASLVVNLWAGFENVRKYGWSEGLGRTGFDILGTLAASLIAGGIAATIAAATAPIVAIAAATVLGLGANLAVAPAVEGLKRFYYGAGRVS